MVASVSLGRYEKKEILGYVAKKITKILLMRRGIRTVKEETSIYLCISLQRNGLAHLLTDAWGKGFFD